MTDSEQDGPDRPSRLEGRLRKPGETSIDRSGIMRLVIDQLPIVLWTTDLDLRFTLSVGAALKALNLEENRVVGMSLQDYLQTDDPDNQAIAAHLRALDGETTTYTFDIGGLSWSCNTGPLYGSDGALLGTVGIGLDVTERRDAEEALRLSEERYRRLFEENRDVVFISTPDGRLIDINPAGVALFGFDSREEMLETNIADLYWTPIERTRYLHEIGDGDVVSGLELKLRRRDGAQVVVHETAQVDRDEDGEVAFYRGTLRDVTNRRDLEEQLRQALRMEAAGRMAGAVAHDFNNLLTVIKGRADLIRAQIDQDDRMAPHVEAIREAGDRASELTRQLLTLRRYQVRAPRELEPRGFLQEIEVRLRRVLRQDVELEVTVASDAWSIRADPNQIEQALIRLAVNADEAMPAGGVLSIEAGNVPRDDEKAREKVDLEPEDYVVLTVRDTGSGMSEEVREHIFEPFFSTRRAGSSAGLGLTTVYSVVSQHRGHIRVRSRPGEGTTFFIYLPRHAQA